MRLAKITSNDPVERLAVSVRRSTTELLDQYRQHYKDTYGDDIERSQMVEEMLRNFMATDKDFMKFVEGAKKAGKPARAEAAA